MRKKSILRFLCLAVILCLCGCGRSEDDMDISRQSRQEQVPAREYESTYREFFIPEELDGKCNIIQITEDAFYLIASDHTFCDFYRVSLEEEELIPAKLPFGLSDTEYQEGFYALNERQNALVEEMFATLRLDETDGVTDIVQSRVQLYLYERK